MLFRQSFYRELSFTTLGIFLVLTTIGLIRQIILLFNETAAGTLALDGITILLGFGLLQYIPILLTISLYLGIFLVISRLYRDREMLVWLSSGLSLSSWLRPAAWFALPLIIVIGSLSLFLSPWAISKSEEFRHYLERRNDLSLIHAGSFTDLKRSGGILFVADLNPVSNLVHDIFVQFQDKKQQGVILAKNGQIEEDPSGKRYLRLQEGQRYTWSHTSNEVEKISFSELAKLIELNANPSKLSHIKSDSTLDLWKNPHPNAQAELFWRISLPLSALLLIGVALPLGRVNPRSGRSWNLVTAILIFAIYNNLISIGQTWISQGKSTLPLSFLLSHGTVLAIGLYLFFRQEFSFTLPKMKMPAKSAH